MNANACLIAAAAPHSRAFLYARPCSLFSTRLDNLRLRIVVTLRLVGPICVPHICVCGAAVDSEGTRVSAVASLVADRHAKAPSMT